MCRSICNQLFTLPGLPTNKRKEKCRNSFLLPRHESFGEHECLSSSDLAHKIPYCWIFSLRNTVFSQHVIRSSNLSNIAKPLCHVQTTGNAVNCPGNVKFYSAGILQRTWLAVESSLGFSLSLIWVLKRALIGQMHVVIAWTGGTIRAG